MLQPPAQVGLQPAVAVSAHHRCGAMRSVSIMQFAPPLPSLRLQEACMAAWALSVLEAQTPELWAAEMAFVAACPAAAMDEVCGCVGGCVGGWVGALQHTGT